MLVWVLACKFQLVHCIWRLLVVLTPWLELFCVFLLLVIRVRVCAEVVGPVLVHYVLLAPVILLPVHRHVVVSILAWPLTRSILLWACATTVEWLLTSHLLTVSILKGISGLLLVLVRVKRSYLHLVPFLRR